MNESQKVHPTINGAVVGSETQRPKRELVVLRGKTSSQINQALKAKSPYPARVFLKEDCATCLKEKRRCWHYYKPEVDIPVFFRIKDKDSWIKPKIKTGSWIEVKGYFDNPKNGSSRKSFTAYSYQLLNKEQAKIETYVK